MDFNFEIEINERLFCVEVFGYTPGIPAPYCCDPDNPKFADPGDPAEIKDFEVYEILEDLTKIKPSLLTSDFEKIIEMIFEKGKALT